MPKPPDVKLCFEGDAGILSGLSKEKIWVDHSTTDYTQMMEFNKLVTDKGAWAVEAPITGGLEALKKGQMTVFIAGDPKVADLVIINLKNSEEKVQFRAFIKYVILCFFYCMNLVYDTLFIEYR